MTPLAFKVQVLNQFSITSSLGIELKEFMFVDYFYSSPTWDYFLSFACASNSFGLRWCFLKLATTWTVKGHFSGRKTPAMCNAFECHISESDFW